MNIDIEHLPQCNVSPAEESRADCRYLLESDKCVHSLVQGNTNNCNDSIRIATSSKELFNASVGLLLGLE